MSQKQLTKTIQHLKSKKEAHDAKASSNRFTQKQSQFARRQEERQAAEVATQSASSISRFEAARRQHVGPTAGEGASANAAGNRLMSARGPRWMDKYHLDEPKRNREGVVGSAPTAVVGGLLGVAGSVRGDANGGQDDQPPQKKTRQEKFQEVIASSRAQRTELQRERAEREKDTLEIDEAFSSVMHLLQKRDRVQEERDAFLASGTQEVRDLLSEFKKNHVAKVLRVESSSASAPKTPGATAATTSAASVLDAEDQALLAKLIGQRTDEMPTKRREDVVAGPSSVAEALHDSDDFDLLMGSMRKDTRRAHAVERTLTEEEELAHIEKMQRLEAHRSAAPRVSEQGEDLTRKEILARGGEHPFQMQDEDEGNAVFDEEGEEDVEVDDLADGDGLEDADDLSDDGMDNGDEDNDDDGANQRAALGTSGNAVDSLIAELEAFVLATSRQPSSEDGAKEKKRREWFAQFVERLHATCRKHPVYAAEAYRLILMDAQQHITKRKPFGKLLIALLSTIPLVYPVTDFRHDIATPFFVLLSSYLMQASLRSLEEAKEVVVVCSLLVRALQAAGKVCAEVMIAALNLVALQAHHTVLQPAAREEVRLPCPLLQRDAPALFAPQPTAPPCAPEQMIAPLQLLSPFVEPVEQLLFAAYKLIAAVALLHDGSAAFSYTVANPVRRAFSLIDAHVHPALRVTHDATLATVESMNAKCCADRTPLAMRTFRPRPIRQFEPLLVENADPELTERRVLKRELREDRKHVVRQVQADATVERRMREKEATADAARRESKYNELMAELQSQQHIMKTVDLSLARAKSKKRKSVSGLPNSSADGDAAGGAAD